MGFNQNKLLGTLLLALAQFASATTWYVNGVTGSNSNNCKSATTACKTIGHAISLASSGDSIMVAAATYTENLGISISLKIIGVAAKTTIIDGGGKGRVVTISSASARVTLSELALQNGSGMGSSGGGVLNVGTLTINNSTVNGNSGFVAGGGIDNGGKLTINNSTISGNTVSVPPKCVGFCFALGGGIYDYGTLTINNSTISANNAGGGGGGIYHLNQGTLTINNSTISANNARVGCSEGCSAYGGGINSNGGELTINNSTISDNNAVAFCKFNCHSGGDGIDGDATVQNTILANNSGENCFGTINSKGYNLSSDSTCNLNNTGDLNSTDPKLGGLQNNGGPTETQALLPGSPAIDAGNPSGCTDNLGHLLKTDQRGSPRPDKEDSSGCDMGAYESQAIK